MKVTQIKPDHRRHDRFSVLSDSKKMYTVTYEGCGDGDPDVVHLWSCNCPAYKYTRDGLCKHIAAVVQYLDD